MAYEYKKLTEITDSQLEALEAQGWEYVGQVQAKNKKGEKVDTGVMRFRRLSGQPSDSDVKLTPKDVKQRQNSTKS